MKFTDLLQGELSAALSSSAQAHGLNDQKSEHELSSLRSRLSQGQASEESAAQAHGLAESRCGHELSDLRPCSTLGSWLAAWQLCTKGAFPLS